MNEPIFGSLGHRSRSNRQAPRSAGAAPPSLEPAIQQTGSASSDTSLIAILEAPLRDGDTAAVGFARKEAELRHIMGALGVLDAYALKSRLSYPKSGDRLAEAFTRLTADRRARLVNFLADVRRREACKATGAR